MSGNGFNEACPSGNVMIDGFNPIEMPKCEVCGDLLKDRDVSVRGDICCKCSEKEGM